MQLSLHHDFPVELKAAWDALLFESSADVPFLRFDFLNTWWETRGGGEWPHAELAIITAEEDGRLCGAAPFFIAENHGRRSLMLLGSIEVFDYLDFIARPQDLPEFVEALLDFIPTIGLAWDVLDLYNIIDHSPTLPLLQSAAEKRSWNFQLEQLQSSPYIPLPGDWETYLAGIKKKQRHEIRRKMRRLEENETPSRWYTVEDGDDLHAEMDAFLALMEQDAEKVTFLTQPMRDFMHQVADSADKAGILQLSFLEIDGRKAAGKFLFNYRNRIWAYNSGVDQFFREHSPGWVLLGFLLQWANEHEIEEFDFMRGDEEYKYRFGAIDRFVMRATLSRRPAQK